jgi:hypothetical protein
MVFAFQFRFIPIHPERLVFLVISWSNHDARDADQNSLQRSVVKKEARAMFGKIFVGSSSDGVQVNQDEWLS